MISSAKRASRLLIVPGRFDQRGKRAAHSSENKAAGSTIWSWSRHAFLQSRATISRVAQRVGANPCHHGDRVGAVVMIGVLELERIAVSSCSSNHAGRRALGDLGCDGRTLQVSELTGRRSVEKDAILRAVPVESYSTSQRVAIAGTGWFSLGPVSTIVNNIMMSEKTCLDSRSPSSLQNRLFRYFTDTTRQAISICRCGYESSGLRPEHPGHVQTRQRLAMCQIFRRNFHLYRHRLPHAQD
jgi:hypothetical protein